MKTALLRFLLFLALPFSAHAQYFIPLNDLEVSTQATNDSLFWKARFTLPAVAGHHIDTVYLPVWPAAYAYQNSFLAKQLLEDHEIKSWFSLPKKSKTSPLQVILGNNAERLPSPYPDLLIFKIIDQSKDTEIALSLKIPMPQNMPTGFGFINGSLRLFNLWHPPITDASRDSVHLFLNNVMQVKIPQKSKGDFTYHLPEGNYSIASPSLFREVNLEEKHPPITLENEFEPAVLAHKLRQKKSWDTSQETAYEGPMGFDFFYESEKGEIFLSPDFGHKLCRFLHKVHLKANCHFDIQIFVSAHPLPLSANAIYMAPQYDTALQEVELLYQSIKYLLYQMGANPMMEHWFVEGLSRHLANQYLIQHYPEKKLLGPYANNLLSRFFDLEKYPPHYLNQYLYTFLARENLDAPLGLSPQMHSKLGYQSAFSGKAAQVFAFLEHYVEEKNFYRGLQRWFENFDPSKNTVESFVESQSYYSFKDLSWFRGDLISSTKKADYALTNVAFCSSVFTATVQNRGNLPTPYQITGFKEGKPLVTLSYDGHKDKKTQQFHLEDYERVEVNYPGYFPELSYKNNAMRTSGLFRRHKPMRLQFYTSLENPNKAQIFWTPALKYNEYDGFLLGAQFYNTTLMKKRWEYRISPDFSTRTQKLTGALSLRHNRILSSGPFRLMQAGIFTRYYHYAPDLAFWRSSASVNLLFHKPNPRSPLIRALRFRTVTVQREQEVTLESPTRGVFEGFTIFNARYEHDYGHALRPHEIFVDLQLGDAFGKLSMEGHQRYRISKTQWAGVRGFAGVFLYRDDNLDPEFDFGLSGTTDYLFDWYFFGRSDQTGIWSRQMFETDGGFKSETNAFANNFLLSVNGTYIFYRWFGVFADAAYAGNLNRIFYDGGLRLSLLPDFFDVYFPLVRNDQWLGNQMGREIRFVLNLYLDDIVQRYRRGYF